MQPKMTKLCTCSNSISNYMDEYYDICVNCHCLIERITEPMKLAKSAIIEAPQNCNPNIKEISAQTVQRMKDEIFIVSHFVSVGRSWKYITETMNFDCHWKAAQRAYQKIKTGNGASRNGKEAISAAIMEDFNAKLPEILAMKAENIALKTIISTLSLRGSMSTVQRELKRVMEQRGLTPLKQPRTANYGVVRRQHKQESISFGAAW